MKNLLSASGWLSAIADGRGCTSTHSDILVLQAKRQWSSFQCGGGSKSNFSPAVLRKLEGESRSRVGVTDEHVADRWGTKLGALGETKERLASDGRLL
jgi:hypothetical protein